MKNLLMILAAMILSLFTVIWVWTAKYPWYVEESDYSAQDWNPDSKTRAIADRARTTTSPTELVTLASHKSKSVRCAVANRWDIAPKEALLKLAHDEDGYIRECVARNTRAPKEVLSLLARDKYLEIKREVAKNPNTPAEALDYLATDALSSWLTRQWVAENPNVTVETLKKLINDYDKNVRRQAERSLERFKK